MEKIKNILLEIALDCNEEGWNGYGAKPVTQESVETTLAFCALLDERELPDFGPCPWGGISMEWYIEKGNVFNVVVLDKEEIIWAWVRNDKSESGSLVFKGVNIPDKIREILDQLELK